MFVVTEEWIKDNFTERGSLTGAQLRTLGMIPLRLPKGWMKDIEGKEITTEQKEYFEGEAKYTYSKQHAKRLKKRQDECDYKTEVVAEQHFKTIEGIVYNRNWSDDFISSSDFLSTYEWAKTRMKVLSLFGNTCMCCGATPQDGVKICVDHIKPRKFFPSLALDPNNLQILCDVCNLGKGNAFVVNWREGKKPIFSQEPQKVLPKVPKKSKKKRKRRNGKPGHTVIVQPSSGTHCIM